MTDAIMAITPAINNSQGSAVSSVQLAEDTLVLVLVLTLSSILT
jgi:hypothetical protein